MIMRHPRSGRVTLMPIDRAVDGLPPGKGTLCFVTESHYQRPGWFTKHIFNRFAALLTQLGLSVWGSRALLVRGRTRGVLRETR